MSDTTIVDERTPQLLRDKAARGATLLDCKQPGWYHHIVLSNLRMVSSRSCVLGQLFDSFALGMRILFDKSLIELPVLLSQNVHYDHGFAIPDTKPWSTYDPRNFTMYDPMNFNSYDTLTQIWKDLINERRETEKTIQTKESKKNDDAIP